MTKITNAMVEAGAAFAHGYDPDYDDPKAYAAFVYEAMEAARLGLPAFKEPRGGSFDDTRWNKEAESVGGN